jgi:hypothetical protein
LKTHEADVREFPPVTFARQLHDHVACSEEQVGCFPIRILARAQGERMSGGILHMSWFELGRERVLFGSAAASVLSARKCAHEQLTSGDRNLALRCTQMIHYCVCIVERGSIRHCCVERVLTHRHTFTSKTQLPLFFRFSRFCRSYSASIQPFVLFLSPSPSTRSRICVASRGDLAGIRTNARGKQQRRGGRVPCLLGQRVDSGG